MRPITSDGQHTRFYYDQSGHVLATEDVSNQVKHSFFMSGLGKDMATIADIIPRIIKIVIMSIKMPIQ